MLAAMTDEVGELVLDDNRAQTLALAIARRQALPMVNVHGRYLNLLEAEGWLNRALEFLPTDRQIAERQAAGTGLTTPEFSVLLAYTKSANIDRDHAQRPARRPVPACPSWSRYFPAPLRERYAAEILAAPPAPRDHRHPGGQPDGQPVGHLVRPPHGRGDRASSVVETGPGVGRRPRHPRRRPQLWHRVDALAGAVKADVQMELFLELRSMAERGDAVAAASPQRAARHRRGRRRVRGRHRRARRRRSSDVLRGRMRDARSRWRPAGWRPGCRRTWPSACVQWPLLHTGVRRHRARPAHRASESTTVAAVYWQVFETLDLRWLWDAIGGLPRSDRWQTQARAALRDDLLAALAELTADALAARAASTEWFDDERAPRSARTVAMFTEIRRVDAPRHHHAHGRRPPAAQPRPRRPSTQRSRRRTPSGER